MVGKFAKSKAGHDKDQIYVILKEDAEYVYLVDGKIKTINKPKMKRKKHISLMPAAWIMQGRWVTESIVKLLPMNRIDNNPSSSGS